jgi:hypothetical protein
MKKYLVVIIACAVLAAGCKSKSDPKPASSNSYFPVTSGSTWNYDDKVGTNASTTLIITMTGQTATINSKKYYTATSTSSASGTTTGYYYATGHSFAIRATNASAAVTIELQLGNDSLAVGSTWTTTPTDNGTVSGFAARTINTIKEKGITKVVNGKTYTDVIHTQVDLQYNLGLAFNSTAVYDFYLAKGVGMIETDTSVNGIAYETEILTGYTIK